MLLRTMAELFRSGDPRFDLWDPGILVEVFPYHMALAAFVVFLDCPPTQEISYRQVIGTVA